jgi:tRNA(Ile)-lysidine synthase
MTPRRPRLTPAIADVRRAVRHTLANHVKSGACVLVGLSGGADSLALAAACAFEAQSAGFRAGAIIVDHGLHADSAAVAATAASQAERLGLAPIIVTRVHVERGPGSKTGGVEAAARKARHGALADALERAGATHVLLGHTLDDQAETVLLGLARGSGSTSLQGMAERNGAILRPLLTVKRVTTHTFCADSGLVPWHDPHNDDPAYARVRVRHTVLPLLESELGPGIADALARTAEQLREDSAALDQLVRELTDDIVEHAEAGIAVSVAALAANPAAIRQRIVRYVVESEFGVSLDRDHTLAVTRLVTDWHGQLSLDLPGVRVERHGAWITFSATNSTARPTRMSLPPAPSD